MRWDFSSLIEGGTSCAVTPLVQIAAWLGDAAASDCKENIDFCSIALCRGWGSGASCPFLSSHAPYEQCAVEPRDGAVAFWQRRTRASRSVGAHAAAFERQRLAPLGELESGRQLLLISCALPRPRPSSALCGGRATGGAPPVRS